MIDRSRGGAALAADDQVLAEQWMPDVLDTTMLSTVRVVE